MKAVSRSRDEGTGEGRVSSVECIDRGALEETKGGGERDALHVVERIDDRDLRRCHKQRSQARHVSHVEKGDDAVF